MFIAILYPDDDTNINEQVSVQMQLFYCTHYNIHISEFSLVMSTTASWFLCTV